MPNMTLILFTLPAQFIAVNKNTLDFIYHFTVFQYYLLHFFFIKTENTDTTGTVIH